MITKRSKQAWISSIIISSGLLAPLLCLVSSFSLATSALALNLNKRLEHYAMEMEFYYQKPRPEAVARLIDGMNDGGALEHGENRLMLAAFLAELARNGSIDLRQLQKPEVDKNLRRVLGWSAHLAQMPDEREYLKTLLEPQDATLMRQILASPAPLAKWPLLSEKTVLKMYWSAFMASGDTTWVDDIIDAARQFARDQHNGRCNSPACSVGKAAAASLYEFASGHELVEERIKAHAQNASGAELDMLSLILNHAAHR